MGARSAEPGCGDGALAVPGGVGHPAPMRVLLALVLLGLLLPRTGAALAEGLGLGTVVICRGDALVTVTLAADGTPVEAEIEDHGPCLATALPRPRRAPGPAWIRWAAAPVPASAGLGDVARRALWSGPPPLRAPPA